MAIVVALAGMPLRGYANDEPSVQRAQFVIAYAAAKLGGSDWRALATGLKDYPLYPYIEAAAMQHDIHTLKTPQVKAWLAKYPDLIPADKLRRAYLSELVRRQDWEGFRALYRPGMGTALACDELRARLADGAKLDFDRDLSSLWKHTSLPSDCTPVLNWAHDHSLLTHKRLWQRIDAAAAHGPARTIDALAKWLPKSQATAAKRLALARRDPARAVSDAKKWPDNTRARQAAALALTRRARRNSLAADTAWESLRKHFSFTASQRHHIEATVALYRATNYPADALQRLTDLPAAAQTGATRAWRVRVALAGGDWKAVLAAVNAMPAEQQDDDTWRYWRARALAETGHKDQARPLFRSLARDADYLGFLSADWINAPYAICPSKLAGDDATELPLLKIPGLDRAFEFYALGLLKPARREWNRAQPKLDKDQRRLAADLAYRRGWWDRAIYTFSSGNALHLYKQRFPLAREQQVLDGARAAGIDPAWAYAIIRAESAWMPDAHSGADARGLMQLLPRTAAAVARKHKLAYGGAAALYDPDVNIPLGTQYLGAMAARFDGAPWLASAAYNAGASNVDKWLAARSELAPDVFVATMPFKETRAYVRRVMAYSVVYDWRIHGSALPVARRMPPIGKTYVAPDAHSKRKPVLCPAADTDSARSANSPAVAASAKPQAHA